MRALRRTRSLAHVRENPLEPYSALVASEFGQRGRGSDRKLEPSLLGQFLIDDRRLDRRRPIRTHLHRLLPFPSRWPTEAASPKVTSSPIAVKTIRYQLSSANPHAEARGGWSGRLTGLLCDRQRRRLATVRERIWAANGVRRLVHPHRLVGYAEHLKPHVGAERRSLHLVSRPLQVKNVRREEGNSSSGSSRRTRRIRRKSATCPARYLWVTARTRSRTGDQSDDKWYSEVLTIGPVNSTVTVWFSCQTSGIGPRLRSDPCTRRSRRLITAEIRRGAFRPGSPLPPERVMCEQLGVSRVTCERLCSPSLTTACWLPPTDGRGSSPTPCSGELPNMLQSLTEVAVARGLRVTSRVTLVHVREASLDEAEQLDRSGSPLFEMRRLRRLDDVPVSLHHVRLPLDICPHLPEVDFESASLYQTLEHHGVRLVRCDIAVQAVPATPRDAEELEVAPSSPLLQPLAQPLVNETAPLSSVASSSLVSDIASAPLSIATLTRNMPIPDHQLEVNPLPKGINMNHQARQNWDAHPTGGYHSKSARNSLHTA